MHSVAEYGIAAHWKYKEYGSVGNTPVINRDDGEKFNWLRQLVEVQKDIKDDQEYIDSLKQDLFDGEIYVFTPKGDVHCLPRGATPVDFAYRIHTEVGNHCAGALVNQRMVSLDRNLQNGDTVTILRQNNAHPSLDWINFAATSTAKNRIRQWYKRSRREENLNRGRDLLEKELGKTGLDTILKSDQMVKVVERCNYHTTEDLIAALGYGEISINIVTNKLRENQQPINQNVKLPASPLSPPSKSPIIGIEGMVYHIAGCCHPLPGEPIIGVVTLGGNRSISVHKQDCTNFINLQSDRLIPVSWNKADQCDRPATYPVDIQVETIDRVGVLKDILSRLADHKVNVRDASVKTSPGKTAFINMTIEISDRSQFEKICSKINKMSDIVTVRRINQTVS
jgi:GTP diphosphokinase / guanosine-3',5'-bis(diphosphate) 3'-diphosphatase